MHQHSDDVLITEFELATRWRVTQRTIRRWRQEYRCPPHMRIGIKVFYCLSDVREFERGVTQRFL